jgi:hypothetical protein
MIKPLHLTFFTWINASIYRQLGTILLMSIGIAVLVEAMIGVWQFVFRRQSMSQRALRLEERVADQKRSLLSAERMDDNGQKEFAVMVCDFEDGDHFSGPKTHEEGESRRPLSRPDNWRHTLFG